MNRGRILRYGVELEIWPDCIGIVNNGLSIHANGGGLASLGNGTLLFGTPPPDFPCVTMGSPISAGSRTWMRGVTPCAGR